jgi:hypothetical protein
MKRKVCFVIPASPTNGFLAQIAAFNRAAWSLDWLTWEPSFLVSFGGGCTTEALAVVAQWQPFLKNVTTVFPTRSSDNRHYYDQIDAGFRYAPDDADVVVRVDADTLPVSNLESILDYVLQHSAIAGTIAHYRFPGQQPNRMAWSSLAAEFLARPLSFKYCYSLADRHQAYDERSTPFYVNDGCVFFSATYLKKFVPLYLALRPRLMDRLEYPYFAGQVALALAVAQIELPAVALPMRYNFPNDETAALRYPEELENACIFHYLRESEFRRDLLFQSSEHYADFLSKSLNSPNTKFQSSVRKLLGEAYPFTGTPATTPYDAVDQCAPPDGTPAKPTEQESSGQDAPTVGLEALMWAKQSMAKKYGRAEGYSQYRRLLSIPESVPLRHLSLMGQGAYGRLFGEPFVQTHAGGQPFRVKPAKVVGEGHCSEFLGRSRPMHILCLRDAIVRGASSVLETKYHALLEFEDEELDYFDCEFEIDPAIFIGDRHSAWVISGDAYPGRIEVDEAFTLLGPHLGAFGDFMMTYLPRYVSASLSGVLPPVPVLISEDIPATIENALQIFIGDQVPLVKVAPFQPVRVQRLWCASNLHYAPSREVMDERYSPAHTFPSPDAIVPVVRELRRRALPYIGATKTEPRIYLARRPQNWRAATNSAEIEAIAEKHGFRIVFPEDLDFSSQISLLFNATYVVAPEGAALFLCYFAQPGTKICILSHPFVDGINSYDVFFDSCEISVVTGPLIRPHPIFPHRGDYFIHPTHFEMFLSSWVG